MQKKKVINQVVTCDASIWTPQFEGKKFHPKLHQEGNTNQEYDPTKPIKTEAEERGHPESKSSMISVNRWIHHQGWSITFRTGQEYVQYQLQLMMDRVTSIIGRSLYTDWSLRNPAMVIH